MNAKSPPPVVVRCPICGFTAVATCSAQVCCMGHDGEVMVPTAEPWSFGGVRHVVTDDNHFTSD